MDILKNDTNSVEIVRLSPRYDEIFNYRAKMMEKIPYEDRIKRGIYKRGNHILENIHAGDMFYDLDVGTIEIIASHKIPLPDHILLNYIYSDKQISEGSSDLFKEHFINIMPQESKKDYEKRYEEIVINGYLRNADLWQIPFGIRSIDNGNVSYHLATTRCYEICMDNIITIPRELFLLRLLEMRKFDKFFNIAEETEKETISELLSLYDFKHLDNFTELCKLDKYDITSNIGGQIKSEAENGDKLLRMRKRK